MRPYLRKKGLCRYNQVKDLKIKSSRIRVGPKPSDKCPHSDKRKTHREDHVRIKQLRVCSSKPEKAWRHQKLGEERRSLFYSFQKERDPANTLMLDIQIYEKINSCCLKSPACGHLSRLPYKTNTVAYVSTCFPFFRRMTWKWQVIREKGRDNKVS